jgi:hypothetical protein
LCVGIKWCPSHKDSAFSPPLGRRSDTDGTRCDKSAGNHNLLLKNARNAVHDEGIYGLFDAHLQGKQKKDFTTFLNSSSVCWSTALSSKSTREASHTSWMTRSKTMPYSTSLDKPKCRQCIRIGLGRAEGESENERERATEIEGRGSQMDQGRAV